MTYRWKDFGLIAVPGVYHVAGIGDVQIEQRDIEDVEELGGDALIDLSPLTTSSGGAPQLEVSGMLPLPVSCLVRLKQWNPSD